MVRFHTKLQPLDFRDENCVIDEQNNICDNLLGGLGGLSKWVNIGHNSGFYIGYRGY